MYNMKALSVLVRKLWPRLKFFKSMSTLRSRGQKLWYHVKGLVTRNTHVQYESSISYGKKVMAKVKVFVHSIQRQRRHQGYDISSPDIRPGSLKSKDDGQRDHYEDLYFAGATNIQAS